MKILFQGDSVTDAGRDRSNPHDLGEGYPKYAAAMLQDAFPDVEFEFVDLGIGGNRTENLVERLENDFLAIQPDIVSIMIGINDVWHRHSHNIATTDEDIERNFRVVLDALKAKTQARILIIQPILMESANPNVAELREELTVAQSIIKRLADEYADAYLPLDTILNTETTEAPTYYTADGIHPTPDGACYIGEAYLKAIAPLVELLSKEAE